MSLLELVILGLFNPIKIHKKNNKTKDILITEKSSLSDEISELATQKASLQKHSDQLRQRKNSLTEEIDNLLEQKNHLLKEVDRLFGEKFFLQANNPPVSIQKALQKSTSEIGQKAVSDNSRDLANLSEQHHLANNIKNNSQEEIEPNSQENAPPAIGTTSYPEESIKISDEQDITIKESQRNFQQIKSKEQQQNLEKTASAQNTSSNDGKNDKDRKQEFDSSGEQESQTVLPEPALENPSTIDHPINNKKQLLTLSAPLTIANADELKTTLLKALKEHQDIEIDLSQVAEVEIPALQLFYALKIEAAKKQLQLRFITTEKSEMFSTVLRDNGFYHLKKCFI